MLCKEFKCAQMVDNECDELGGGCIGNMCENWGECTGCQNQDKDDCEGMENERSDNISRNRRMQGDLFDCI